MMVNESRWCSDKNKNTGQDHVLFCFSTYREWVQIRLLSKHECVTQFITYNMEDRLPSLL